MADEVADRIAELADEHPDRANDAAAWLLERPELSRPRLLELVEADHPDQRTRQAVRLLGRLGYAEDVPLLAALISRPESGLVWEAAQALVLHPSPLAAEALREAMRAESTESVEAATSALGERRDELGRPVLEALLDHPSEAVRHRAVHALGRLGAAKSVGALREAAARDPSADVRASIAAVLAQSD